MSIERDGGGRSRTVQRLIWLARSPWVRAGVTLLLLALVASRLNWSQIGARVRDGQPVDFLVAVGLVVLALIAGAWRWGALLHRAGVPIGTGRLARIYAVSTFSSSFLPTTAGGDVTRALLVTRHGPELRRVAVSIVVDRAGGLAGLIGIAWLAFALEPSKVPAGTLAILGWTTVALVVAGLLVVAAMFRNTAARRIVPDRLVALARDARDVLREYGRSPGLIGSCLCLSIVYQGLIAFQLVMLGQAIDVNLPFSTAAVALTLVTLATLAPISIGGFGVREGSYVVLLGGISIAASDAALISVLSVATLLLASLPGAFLIMSGNVGAIPKPVQQ